MMAAGSVDAAAGLAGGGAAGAAWAASKDVEQIRTSVHKKIFIEAPMLCSSNSRLYDMRAVRKNARKNARRNPTAVAFSSVQSHSSQSQVSKFSVCSTPAFRNSAIRAMGSTASVRK